MKRFISLIIVMIMLGTVFAGCAEQKPSKGTQPAESQPTSANGTDSTDGDDVQKEQEDDNTQDDNAQDDNTQDDNTQEDNTQDDNTPNDGEELSEAEKLELMKKEIEQRIVNNASYSSFKEASSGFEATGFDYAYLYEKKTQVAAPEAQLSIYTNGLSGISFDIYVAEATDGSVQYQLDGGAVFVSVKDSDGNVIEAEGDPAMPYVVLKQGKSYSVELDLSGTRGLAAIKIWWAKGAMIYYSTFDFKYGEDPENTSWAQSVIYKSQETLGYFAWPSVESLGGDKLIAVASGFRQGHVDPYGKVVGWISEDNGESWSEPFVIADTVLDDRDAGVIYWQGKIIVTWFTAPVRNYQGQGNSEWDQYCADITAQQEAEHLGANMVVSEDGGETWSEPELIPVFSPHGFIETPEGELAYIGYSHYDQTLGAFTKIGMITSADGVTWSDVKVIADTATKTQYGFDEPHGIYAADGTLIVQLRTSRGIYQCETKDNGDSFTEFRLICAAKDTPPHLLRLDDGTLVLTYGYRASPFGVRARLSYDNGNSWTDEYIITGDGTEWDMGYADTVQLSDGRMLTVYYQKQLASDRHVGIMQVIWKLPDKPKNATITFDSKGGSEVAAISGAFGLAVSEPAEPIYTGYHFGGWYTDVNCTQKYIFSILSTDITLYAKWISNIVVPNANGERYLREATEAELDAAGYTGNGDAYVYTKPTGEGGSASSSAELWFNALEEKGNTLTFSFYMQSWDTDANRIIEVDCLKNGGFVHTAVSFVKQSDDTSLEMTRQQNGFTTVVEEQTWYTVTVDLTGCDKADIFCYWSCGMTAILTDIEIN